MFEKSKIQELQNMIGYERWIIRNSLDNLNLYNKAVTKEILYYNNSYCHNCLTLSDNLWEPQLTNIIMDFSPLLFVTTFKLLDMLIEWIINENQIIKTQSSRTFEAKINYINKHNRKLKLPHLLNNNKGIFNRIFKLYSNLRVYRNKLVHGAWGKNINGDLCFDFVQNGINYTKKITMEQIFRFCDSITLIIDEIVSPTDLCGICCNAVKWDLDYLSNMHEQPLYNIKLPVLFKIFNMITSDFNGAITINLEEIRERLNKESMGNNYEYIITIIDPRGDKQIEWRIPSTALSKRNEITVDSSWDNYKLQK